MADDGLIAAYLRELAYSVAELSDAADIVAEAEDHLLETVHRLTEAGLGHTDAEAEAVARFGSAALVSRICVIEAKRGAAVPTIRTRAAGLAALLTPAMLIVGQSLNVSVDRGVVHGIGVSLLVAAIGAFVFALWGLRERHGGLGRIGRIAVTAAVISPFLTFVAGYAGVFVAMGVLGLAVVALVVEMLRANVLPVVALVLVAAGPVLALAVALAVTAVGGDAGDFWYYPMLLTAVGYLWLGVYLWREPAVDRPHRHPLAPTIAH